MNGAVFFLAFFLRALILKMALLWLAALGIQQVAEHIRESEVRKGIPKHVLDSPKFKGNPREQPKFSQDLCDAAKRNDVEEIARLIQRGYASPNATSRRPSTARSTSRRRAATPTRCARCSPTAPTST